MAGGRQYPLILARAARNHGFRVAAVALSGETDPALAGLVDEILWVKIGQLQKSIDFLKERGVAQAVMAGGVTKENLFVNFDPDPRALAAAATMTSLNDDSLLRAMAGEFEKDGIRIEPTTLFAPELLAAEGVLTRTAPTSAQEADIALGWTIAKAIGRLDVGQCVVVRDKVVLAVEAIEGSDETIRRGGRLGHGNVVVVKVVKPGQDLRFDLPSVGLGTVAVMKEAGAAVLCIEAGATLMFDRDEMLAEADHAGLVIVARKGEA